VNKKPPAETPIIDAKLMDSAKKYVFDSKPRATHKCRVCDEPGASAESEGLCWVCRRLKISAWREIEVQMPMNE
jgi:hypothetical protein